MAIRHLVTASSPAFKVTSNTQSINFEALLPFAGPALNISRDPNDYYLTAVPILTSDLPNRNGVGMPLRELAMWNVELGRQAYMGWKGMPLHYEHKSDDPLQAIGIIADVALAPVVGFNGGRIYKVVALAAVDMTKRTNITSRIASGDLFTWSMGCEVDSYSCAYCGKPEGECIHIDPKKDVEFYEMDGYIIYRNVHGIKPFELSAVEDPAFPSAIGNHDWSMRYSLPTVVSPPR